MAHFTVTTCTPFGGTVNKGELYTGSLLASTVRLRWDELYLAWTLSKPLIVSDCETRDERVCLVGN